MTSSRPFLIFLILSAFAVSLGVGASATFHDAPSAVSKKKNPFRAGDRAAVKAGAQLFATNCASCHGTEAQGTGNVPALAQGQVQSARDGEVFWFISHGSVENGMPPCKLPERERWQIITFIKALPSGAAPAAPIASAAANTTSGAPAPAAPFTDYRFEAPGVKHKILATDLPPPAPETTVGNAPDVVPRPKDAWPKVPPGFHVQLFANGMLNNPRLLRTAPNGDVFLAESNPGRIRVFRGVTAEGKAERNEVFATGLDQPYGIAFYPPGPNPQWLYIGDTDAVVRFPYKTGDLHASGPTQKIADLPHGSRGHWTRDLQFSADGQKLFVAVGSASNVDDPDTTPAEKNRADILVMKPDGSDVRVYASGIRNAGGGLAVSPNGELWASVNERDGLGDNLVPDYISRVHEGEFFGWPWWYIGGHQDPRHVGTHPELKEKLATPDILLQPHHASLEITFYQGQQFPAEYAGDLFSSQHGSWNRSIRTGYELIRVPLHQSGKPTGDYEDFMTGFVVDDAHVWGRPVGVTVASDGALLVSDDGSNTVWRITYDGK